MNLPDYNFLSAPLWLISTLHTVTLALHFVAMNFMVGGIIVVLFGRFEDGWQNPVVRRFVKLFPTAMAATVTLGVAPLLFLQLVYHRQAYAAAIVSGWFWLMIVVAAIIGYYFLYAGAFAGEGRRRTGLFLASALVCFLYISFVYSSVFSMAERPDLYKVLYADTQSGLVIDPDVGSYIFRWLHMLLGAVTVGGFFVGLLGRDSERAYEVGKTFFLYGMAAAAVAGLIYLLQLGDYLQPFMRSAAVWWWALAVVLSLGSLHFFLKKKFTPAAAMLLVSLFGMVVVRHNVRLLNLKGYFDPTDLAVKPQWSAFAIFLICFVAAVGAVWYMLRLYFADRKEST